jgi:hypothetical protein
MVLKTEHAARFQRPIEGCEGCERLFGESFLQPIVKVAKREDEIGQAGWSNLALSKAKNSRRKLAVSRLVGLDLAAEEGIELVSFSVRSLASSFRLHYEEGRKNFRPVAAARPYLDQSRLWRNAKEGELIE